MQDRLREVSLHRASSQTTDLAYGSPGSASDPGTRWMARAAVGAVTSSVALMTAVGFAGPSAAVVKIPSASGWPPWFLHARPSPALVSSALWLAVLVGGVGVSLGLLAVRRDWRPNPRRMILGSVLAVAALIVIPPVGSADMLLYVVSGRIAELGHSPYVMTPAKLRALGDPVGLVAARGYLNDPSRYGPVATALEAAASSLGRLSVTRTILWLKVWDALAYLTLVLALDRVTRSHGAMRARAHLLWSVNPLMLLAVMAGGHNDVLAMSLGALAVFTFRRPTPGRGLLAGILLGLAVGIKAPFVLFGIGLAWIARRSPAALALLALGAGSVLLPAYLLAGRPAISATARLAASAPSAYVPWFAVVRLLHLNNATREVAVLALIGSVVLAIILVRSMPSGWDVLPAARITLAVTLALLIISPQQRPWYDVMIFPLLVMYPATRLDWVVVSRSIVGALGGLPRNFYGGLHPSWLYDLLRVGSAGSVPLLLTIVGAALLWLCISDQWAPAVDWTGIKGGTGTSVPRVRRPRRPGRPGRGSHRMVARAREQRGQRGSVH